MPVVIQHPTHSHNISIIQSNWKWTLKCHHTSDTVQESTAQAVLQSSREVILAKDCTYLWQEISEGDTVFL